MTGKRGRSGRKPTNTKIYNVKFRLRPGRDDDLIQFFESVPPGRRIEALKAALRDGNLVAGLDMAQATEEADQSDLIDALADWRV